MRLGKIRWVSGSSWRPLGTGAAALAAVGVLGAVPGATAAASPQAPGAQALSWSVINSPNIGTSSNELVSVSCAAAGACMTVGGHAGGVGRTLTESWNGTKWSAVPSVSPGRIAYLEGVSCVSAGACTAVGFYGPANGPFSTLIESWDGTSWSVVPSPNPGTSSNELLGVSCVSAAACTAVGYRTSTGAGNQTLIESWDGTSWSVVPSPNQVRNDRLSGVSCASARACMAVGSFTNNQRVNRTLAERWNGTSWSVVPSPSPGTGHYNASLGRVSCAATDACLAVGYSTSSSSIAESWNGTRWSVVPGAAPVPLYNQLYDVSCASPDACTLVGYAIPATKGAVPKTLIESWNGAHFSVVQSPNAPGSVWNELQGVSCASTATCTAVGYYNTGINSHARTLIESGTASG